jgi:hypothetical protein
MLPMRPSVTGKRINIDEALSVAVEPYLQAAGNVHIARSRRTNWLLIGSKPKAQV